MNTIKYEEFPKRISTYVKQTNFPIKQVDKQKGLNHWLGNFLFRGHTIEVKISATHLGNYVLSVLIDDVTTPYKGFTSQRDLVKQLNGILDKLEGTK